MKTFIGIFCLFIASCQSPIVQVYNKVPEQKIDISFNSLEEAWQWVDENISYERNNYKKHPEQTYRDKAGDCEDYCLLLQYFLEELGYETELILLDEGEYLHAIVYADNMYLEPQVYNYTYKESNINIVERYTYMDAYYTNEFRAIY